MSKCENCIHYERCDHYHTATGTGKYAYQNIDLSNRDDVEEICDFFKDKSLWRVLPYNVGDAVYLVSQKGGLNVMWYMFEAIVIGFHIDERNALEIRVKCTNTSVDMTGYYREDLVFLTKEEAEKKLKEMG